MASFDWLNPKNPSLVQQSVTYFKFEQISVNFV